MNDDLFEMILERRGQPYTKNSISKSWQKGKGRGNSGFRCGHCHVYVSAEPMLSRVNNRNHCPYCLWSKHVDLHRAGDRLAACKGKMEPVGLTCKHTHKKYGAGDRGELMIIHRCQECETLSINRIAADDIPERILEIYQKSLAQDLQVRSRLEEAGIQPVKAGEMTVVTDQLFGQGEDKSDLIRFQVTQAEFIYGS